MLWLTPVPPDRAGGGGHIRQAELLLALAEEADVHLVCSHPVTDPEVRRAAASVRPVGLEERNRGDKPKILRRAEDLRLAVGSTPREVAAFAGVCREMEPEVSRSSSGVVLVEYAGLAPLIAQRAAGQRWVLTMHNLLSEMAVQEAAVAPGRRQRWLYRRDGSISRRWEERTVAAYDQVIAVSEDDATCLGSAGGAPVRVVPNGVDVNRYSPTDLPPEPRVVFTGALYTGPNRDGIRWFCREVWPLVLRRRPDAELAIVGARPGPDVAGLASAPGVSLHADVPDIGPYLRWSRVCVVPLRIGSGTRLKALEAMSAGRPVVGTAIGLGGLGLRDGEHAAFADDAPGFADAVCRAFEHDAWAASLAAEGRRLAEERYDWRPIGRRFVEVVLGRV